MRLDRVLKQEEFDALLALFSNDREEAGAAYAELRRNLVRFFEMRNCRDSDLLADETLSRVAARAHTFDPLRHVRPSTFAFGFAAKILLEYTRDPRKMKIGYEAWEESSFSPALPLEEGTDEDDLDRLDKCLGEMSAENRELLISYYSKEKQEKIELRRAMAEKLGIKIETLHIRVYRLREALKKCMKRHGRQG